MDVVDRPFYQVVDVENLSASGTSFKCLLLRPPSPSGSPETTLPKTYLSLTSLPRTPSVSVRRGLWSELPLGGLLHFVPINLNPAEERG